MPQVVEIQGLASQDEADRRAEDFGIDGVPVEIIQQPDGTFTVRATYPDGIQVPGATQVPAAAADQNPPQQAAPQQALAQQAAPVQQAHGAGAAAMKLSPKGAALVKAFESCKEPVPGGFQAYLDPVKVLTIGWGHTNHHGRQFDANAVWTQAECDAEFLTDMAHFESVVHKLVKVQLNQDQFDALVSFAYNLGEGNLGQSTLLKKLNAGDFAGAAQEFPRWNKGDGKVLPGLVRRRASESLMFRSIPDSNYDGIPDA